MESKPPEKVMRAPVCLACASYLAIIAAIQFGSPQSEAMHVVERYRVIEYAEAKAAFDANEKDFGRVDTANGPATRRSYGVETGSIGS